MPPLHTPTEPWEALTTIRGLREVSQSELARRAGVSQSYLSKLELGAKWPGADITQKLAAALDVPVGAIRRLRVWVE